MTAKKSSVQLLPADADDAEKIHAMQKDAFTQLLEKYQDYDTNPACESLDRVLWKIETPGSFYYFIKDQDKTVGCIRIWDAGDGTRKRISPLYILPAHRGNGYAQAAMQEAERIHGAHGWQLDTILQEAGNCYLYEKMGYHQTSRRQVIHANMIIVGYEKD